MSKSAGEVAWVVNADDRVGVVLKPPIMLVISIPIPIPIPIPNGIIGIPIPPWNQCMPFGLIPYGDM